MIDLFGFRARRQARQKEKEEKRKQAEAQALAKAKEEKERYRARKAMIEKFLEDYNKVESDKRAKIYYKRVEDAQRINSTCPLCGSKDVVHNIVRGKGEIHGKGSSSVSGSFGGSFLSIGGSVYGSGSSKIDGKFDTLPVNKCSRCGHEWNLEKAEYPDIEDIFSHWSSSCPNSLYYVISNYRDIKFDPYDPKEEFDSLEEKQENYCNTASNSYGIAPYRKLPRYMIEHALFSGLENHHIYLNHDERKFFNYKDSDDKFSYTMSDKLWEMTKKIIKWEGQDE